MSDNNEYEWLYSNWSKDKYGRDVIRMIGRYGEDYDENDPSQIEPTLDELDRRAVVRGYGDDCDG